MVKSRKDKMPARRTRSSTATEVASNVSAATDNSAPAQPASSSGRRKVSRETILEDFDSLIEYFTEMDANVKKTGFGTFHTPRDLRRPFTETLKSLQRLRRGCDSRLRKTVTRQPATNTGLNKKLNVTRKFARWAGIDADAEYSRMDINRMWKSDIAPRISDPAEYASFCRAIGIPEGGSPMHYRKFQHIMKGAFENE